MRNAQVQKIEGERGQATLRVERSGFVRVRYQGICEAAHATSVTDLLDEWVAEGRSVVIAVDALELHSYSTDFRRHWTRWLLDNRAKLLAFEVLTESRIAIMGIAVVNVATGGAIRAHASHETFDAALAEYVAAAA